ncbi:MAG: hypothetical protein GXX99_03065 [Clostridiales bacterium]|nr:hypothetical protein [Clostridiales bacterium]
MGIGPWVLMLLLELALTVYRMRTNAVQRRATAILRELSVLLPAALLALSTLRWGFRYYALAALLLTSAAVGLLQWLRKTDAKKEGGRARPLWRGGAMMALLSLASLPAILFPEYAPLPATGEYPVKTAVQYLADPDRTEPFGRQGEARALAVEFWYPAHAAGHFPLIVFSHGAFGLRTSNETLFRALASHGYVVCSIDHSGHCLYTTRENGSPMPIDRGYLGELRREDARADRRASLALYQKWMGVRVADIHFVIDSIAARAAAAPQDEVYGLVDAQKIGVIGHSLGGSAALGIGRARGDVGAVIALESPFLCDILAVEDGAFVFEEAPYPVPVLAIYSDSAWTQLADWPQYAQNARLRAGRDKDAYNLHLAGTGHLSLTDLSLASPLLTRLLNGHRCTVSAEDGLTRLNEACLSFFNGFLKDADTVYGSSAGAGRPLHAPSEGDVLTWRGGFPPCVGTRF